MVVAEGFVPDDLAVGDVLCTPVTGAYGHSMASNYNKVPRSGRDLRDRRRCPDGRRRETLDDLVRLDVPSAAGTASTAPRGGSVTG